MRVASYIHVLIFSTHFIAASGLQKQSSLCQGLMGDVFICPCYKIGISVLTLQGIILM